MQPLLGLFTRQLFLSPGVLISGQDFETTIINKENKWKSKQKMGNFNGELKTVRIKQMDIPELKGTYLKLRLIEWIHIISEQI